MVVKSEFGIHYHMASSQHFVVGWLFLVLFCVTTGAYPAPTPTYAPVSDFDDQEVQFLGRFTVDEYNKMGESHLSFVRVVNGSVIFFPFSKEQRLWILQLNAINCSQPGPPALYIATVNENNNNNYLNGSKIQAYGSIFTNGALDMAYP